MNLFSNFPYDGTDFEELILNQATRNGRGVFGPPTYLNHSGLVLCLLTRGLGERESRLLRVHLSRVPFEVRFVYEGADFLVSAKTFEVLLAHGTIDQIPGTDFSGRTRYILSEVGYRHVREWKAGYTA